LISRKILLGAQRAGNGLIWLQVGFIWIVVGLYCCSEEQS
jgi:hypothetical protein